MDYIYTNEIKAMMYAFGDNKYPSTQTAQYLESVLKTQIQRFLSAANDIKLFRDGKFISLEDIGFVIRKDPFKLRRLLNFVNFKEMKSKIESKIDDRSSASEVMDVDPLYDESTSNNTKLEKSSDLIREDPDLLKNNDNGMKFAWMEPVVGEDTFQLNRLHEVDALTASMSREEYLEYAECRQSSFVYRKGKKFKEFIGPWKLHENTIDVLGYICYEIIYNIVSAVVKKRNIDRGFKVRIGQDKPITVDEIDDVCWMYASKNMLFF